MMFRFSGKDNAAVYEGFVGGLQIGKFHSTSAGYGLTLTKAKSFAWRTCADDGGAIFASGSSVRSGERRLLLTAVHTGDISAHGGEDHVKVLSDCSAVTAYIAGGWGYLEMGSVSKVRYAGGVRSMIDCPTGAEVTGAVGAFLAAMGDISGTHSTSVPISVIHVMNPTAGTFDFFASFGSATGAIAAKSTALSGLSSTHRLLVKCPDGNVGYIPVIQTWS
jgi:hypothetical protein